MAVCLTTPLVCFQSVAIRSFGMIRVIWWVLDTFGYGLGTFWLLAQVNLNRTQHQRERAVENNHPCVLLSSSLRYSSGGTGRRAGLKIRIKSLHKWCVLLGSLANCITCSEIVVWCCGALRGVFQSRFPQLIPHRRSVIPRQVSPFGRDTSLARISANEKCFPVVGRVTKSFPAIIFAVALLARRLPSVDGMSLPESGG
jgi:hypothetical protein